MRLTKNRMLIGAVAVGLILVLAAAGLWLEAPLHAVATDRQDGFLMATGWVDDGVEAVYFLDSLTGALRAKVLSNQTQTFQAHYEANVGGDLANLVGFLNERIRQTNAQSRRGMPPQPEVQIPQEPNFMMVTGVADIRRSGAARQRPATAVVYVAETNTGIVMTYLLPWDQHSHASNINYAGALTFWAGDLFTTPLVQSE